ncbi:Zinc finger PHD-type [Arabidopsis suecica]|uniref:Zinc finger PHD-type n=1 Tax=Arabidopsis suecica TaxID=45249 RepID=A0A8T2G854_ARASU|nr:Zinc finger PHD-type [Arabidopsis suecica]
MAKTLDLFWHEHPLYEKYRMFTCQECHRSAIPFFEVFYGCIRCNIKWHPYCVPRSTKNINHPCHPNHPLEVLLQGPPSYSDEKCSLCQRKLSNFVYHCKLCNFSIDMECGNRPPPHKVDHPKCHEHALTLMGREVSFTCNACGTHGERNPYVCLPCSVMFHYDCIDLPHVININRHDHRISHSYPLKRGNWVCEICRQDINTTYGGYSCNKCPDFFVHSKCATRKDVWDGTELEGIPEEVVDVAPFEVIEEGVIYHFSHEKHNLFLIEDVFIDGAEDMHCEACARPVSSEKHYKCVECKFILHEECANLPLTKRHGLSTGIFYLRFGKDFSEQNFSCDACNRDGRGFSYKDEEGVVLDVLCASLSFFKHPKLHPHTLFLTTIDRGTCLACGENKLNVLRCVDCDYSLDYKCATLPLVIKHRCDTHYLVLRSGEEAPEGKYWCEICEAETNPERWFYTCDDCGVVCHIECVTGDFLNIKPGIIMKNRENKFEVGFNDHDSRPKCTDCGSRCRFPRFFKVTRKNIEYYYCSKACFQNAKF